MSLNTTINISTSISWLQTDTQSGEGTSLVDASQVLCTDTFITGGTTGAGQANTVYFIADTLAAGETGVYDLFNLQREILGGTLDVSFSGGTLRGIMIENLATGTNPFWSLDIRSTGSNHLKSPWNSSSAGAITPIYPGSSELKASRNLGYPCSTTTRYITLYNNSSEATPFEMVLVGQVPWSL